MQDITTYASLCNCTYETIQNMKGPTEWIPFCVSQSTWGNLYTLFINEKQHEIIISIRGSENYWNIISDFGLLVSAQTGEANPPPGQEKIERAVGYLKTNLQDIPILNELTKFLKEIESWEREISLWFLSFMLMVYVSQLLLDKVKTLPQFQSINTDLVKLIGSPEVTEQKIRKYIRKREKVLIDKLNRPLKTRYQDLIRKIKSDKIWGLKVIGHSLGGVSAELLACKFGLECVTFESPGSLNIITQVDEYEESYCNLIQSYVSAPNIINTLNPHPGAIFRMHLPHTDGNTWRNVGECVTSSVLVIPAVYLGAGYTFGFGIGTGLLSTLGAGATKFSLYWYHNAQWLRNQHSIERIYKFLEGKGKVSKMNNWPVLNGNPLRESVAYTIGRAFLPVKDVPGLRNIFDEEGMREAQVERVLKLHSCVPLKCMKASL